MIGLPPNNLVKGLCLIPTEEENPGFTKEQLELLNSISPRQISEHSISFFAKHYLQFDVPAHQRKWYDYCTRHRHLMLSPRDHGKTTVFCHAFVVWAICFIPNVRVLLVSKTARQSSKLLKTIRDELSRNERIRKDFGTLMTNKDKGPIWCVRDEDGVKLKDPTVEAVGAEGSITGGHFDIIICDDIIDDENSKTSSRMDDLSNWFYGTIGQLCEPHTQWMVTGTRKHYSDIYQQLIENPLWEKQVDRAIIQYPESYEYQFSTNEDGGEFISGVDVVGESKVLWPEKWGIETLLMDRQATGSILFDREKQNDPSGMKGEFLNVDWLHYYKWQDLPPVNELIFYIGGDLAISEKEKADDTVFVLAAYHDKQRKIYVVEFKYGKWDFPTQQKKLREAYEEWAALGMRASKVILENNVYQAALAQQVAITTWIPAIGRRTDTNKVIKMTSISSHFENKSVLLRKGDLHGMPEFRKEWNQFPYAAHDDKLDALAIVVLEIALGGMGVLGVADPDASLSTRREDEAYEYVFCGDCGEEYGTINGVFPERDGTCDVCGTRIPKIPKHLNEKILV